MIKTYLTTTFNNKIVKIYFDKLDPVKVNTGISVCKISTLRGRDKTFGTYRKAKTITISGAFSTRLDNNIIIGGGTYKLTGEDKIKTLVELFNSFIQDTRLFNVVTFYKEYKNFTITKFGVVYSDNSVIKVDLSLQEVLFRENEEINYSVEASIYPRQITVESSSSGGLATSFNTYLSNLFGG